jgi:hypothetical protein
MSQPVGKQTAAYPPYGARHLELPENSSMDLPTDFDCSVHIQLRFGGNHIKKKPLALQGRASGL